MLDWSLSQSRSLDGQIEVVQNYWKNRRHLLAFTTVYSIFTWIVVSQLLVMVHNSPLNRYGEFSDLKGNPGANPTEKLQHFPNASNAKFGLTYGDPTNPIFDQIAGVHAGGDFISAFPRAYIIATVLSYLALSWGMIRLVKSRTESSSAQFTTIIIGGTILFFSLMLFLFELDPMLMYFQTNGKSVTIFSALAEIPTIFYILIIAQGVIISSLAAVWTRPLLPKELDNPKVIRLHSENWRKYGSWIASLFGGVFLTTAIVFITDLSSVGRYFLQHALVLFAGGLVLHLGFIIYKLTKLEEKFSDLISGKQKSSLLIRRH